MSTAQGDVRSLARCITLVENELDGYEDILLATGSNRNVPVIGITGPPGAGKSTLINQLIKQYIALNKKVAVLAVDPTSPFNYGSILGDRIRMSEHYLNDLVYIRSLATRGALGGLSSKSIEITDVLKSAHFDVIIVETVGVGQSEVEIAGLADTTVLVLVPEAGDEIQSLKSGVMEIADVFVVNKADRPGADSFAKNIQALVRDKHSHIPVVKVSATNETGIADLMKAIDTAHEHGNRHLKSFLLAEKAFRLVEQRRMQDIKKQDLRDEIAELVEKGNFNLYSYIRKFIPGNKLS